MTFVPRPRSLRRPLAVTAVLALAVTLGSVVLGSSQVEAQPLVAPTKSVPTSVALPTVQTDGIVWSVAIVGNTVYAGGRFSHARPAGTAPGDPQEVVRHNILAFDLTTGALLPFAPDVEGTTYTSTTNPGAFCKTIATNTYDCDSIYRIKASPDGSRIYVAGDFTSVNGAGRQRIAAFDTATGALVSTFKPALNGRIRGLAVTADAVYAGGDFTTVNGTVARSRLAAFSPTGAVLPWAPTADKTVWALSAAPAAGRVIVGGYFDTINTTTVHGLMAVDATTGASMPWATRAVSLTSVVTDIVNDGTAAYASGYNFNRSAGAARFEGRMAVELTTGTVRWIDGCYGDTQAVTVMNGVVFGASHSHDCQYMNFFPQLTPTNYQRIVAETTTVGGAYQGTGTTLVPNGAPIPKVVQFLPDLDGGPTTSAWKNGPWSLDNNGTYLVVGGEFLTVNQTPQQSLVRFAVPPTGSLTGAPLPLPTPTAAVQPDGSVRVAYTDTYDRDSTSLRFDLVRDDAPTEPVASVMRYGKGFWNLRTQTLVDRTLPAGTTAKYKIRVTDPEGNTMATNWSGAVTGTGKPALTRYAGLVLADRPDAYWPLDDTSTSTLRDLAAGDDLVTAGGVTTGAAGALTDGHDTGVTFNGTATGIASTTTSRYAPDAASVETWFRTTSTTGGTLMDWASSTTADSGTSANDRKLYLDNAGKVSFGVNPGARQVVTSPTGYRDGQWHHVVGSVGPAGLQLYVDGALVASNTAVTSAQWLTSGYWRLGGDTVSGWPSAPSSKYLAVTMDEAAVYSSQLTPAQVAAHFTGRSPGVPTAAFTSSCSGLACTFDASTSTSPNGAITGYSWTFGDGGTATGATPSHTYGADGTPTVSLTVTDAAGKTATQTQQLTVANSAPTARFTVSCSARTCTVDGRSSSDPDGAVASYAWDFGDGSTGTGATTSHGYAADGSYTIGLTVKDGSGATGTTQLPVTVAGVGPTASFTSACTNLTCSFDASASTAGTAAITGYTWDFGDGATATGVTATHTFAAAGEYPVQVTAKDADGKTGSASNPVRVQAPATTGQIAADGFQRTVASGWGTADLGGPWSVSSTAANYAVSSGTASIVAPSAGSNRLALLSTVSARDVDVTTEVAVGALPAAGSNYVYLVARDAGGTTDYRLRVRYMIDGSVRVALVLRNAATADTLVGTEVAVPGLTVAGGDVLSARFQASGSGTTTLRGRVWRTGTTEPTTWLVSGTDATSALQSAGGVGLGFSASASNTGVPVSATFRTFTVTAP